MVGFVIYLYRFIFKKKHLSIFFILVLTILEDINKIALNSNILYREGNLKLAIKAGFFYGVEKAYKGYIWRGMGWFGEDFYRRTDGHSFL